MPAAEVIGPVAGIEHPMEIGRFDITDHARHEQIFDLGAIRSVAIVEGYAHLPPGGSLRVDNPLAFFSVNGHRFFRDHITTQFHCADNIMVVS